VFEASDVDGAALRTVTPLKLARLGFEVRAPDTEPPHGCALNWLAMNSFGVTNMPSGPAEDGVDVTHPWALLKGGCNHFAATHTHTHTHAHAHTHTHTHTSTDKEGLTGTAQDAHEQLRAALRARRARVDLLLDCSESLAAMRTGGACGLVWFAAQNLICCVCEASV
jgi:hypothetical protein